MKKIVFVIAIIALFLFGMEALAQNGDITGNIYSTDILAFINDVPVQSYNIGGKTAVILEDLSEYGILCFYNDPLRVLTATTRWPDLLLQKQIERGQVGKISGHIYESDITTYVNGMKINTFSLNGKMAVTIEDLSALTDDLEYSIYNMRAVWNEQDRTISLYYLYGNIGELYDHVKDRSLSFRFINDTTEFYTDYFHPGSLGGSHGEGFNPPRIYPIYCNDQKVGTGYKYGGGAYILSHDDTTFTLEESDTYYYGIYFNIEALKSIADAIVAQCH